ncbi:anaerobic ribonucleoside-triphosphate reductase activating protein [bacterium DOLZORAL124_38_8]|nr:MAG: anaerobic ribonucleoside-triphosphate reductase activating protein [bacterium DOLZORAL124_38_8]
MLIGGIQTLTMLDFPGKIAATIFTAGCNFRCGYCHNPELVLPELIKKNRHDLIPEEKFFNFLNTRKGLLDGVAISGGEPTVQLDLVSFIQKIKNQGFLVKLDTNGGNPNVVEDLIKQNLVDYFAMDIKYPLEIYDKMTNVDISQERFEKSIELIRNAGVDYEFRTTVIAEFHDEAKIEQILRKIQGCKKYTLQNFRPEITLDQQFARFHGVTEEKMAKFRDLAKNYVEEVRVI